MRSTIGSGDMRKQYRKVEDVIDLLSPAQIAAVADIYENGDGLLPKEDWVKSTQYYKMAAEMGDAYAQSTLANAYTVGCDVEKSEALALFWYQRSAEQGNPHAQYEVAMRLSDADGALLWLHSSAKQGFPTAMKELSDRLRIIDPRLSQRWLRRYYRKRSKCKIENINGKHYVRQIRKTNMPTVIDGEVVIWI